jgi:hypothetical protein
MARKVHFLTVEGRLAHLHYTDGDMIKALIECDGEIECQGAFGHLNDDVFYSWRMLGKLIGCLDPESDRKRIFLMHLRVAEAVRLKIMPNGMLDATTYGDLTLFKRRNRATIHRLNRLPMASDTD